MLRSETKRSKIQVYFFAFFTFFAFFHYFSLFFAFSPLFFAFFASNFSLRFDLVIFASKRNKERQNSSQFFCFFSLFFVFFSFFSLFSLNFRFTSIFSLNFCLFYLRFRFRFLVFHMEVNHVKSGFFFASKRNEIFASISNFASEAKVRAHPSIDPGREIWPLVWMRPLFSMTVTQQMCELYSIYENCISEDYYYYLKCLLGLKHRHFTIFCLGLTLKAH